MMKTVSVVIEHFKGGDAAPVYRYFRDRGRLAPDGLRLPLGGRRARALLSDHGRDDLMLLHQWMANWSDIIDFEVHPVVTSAQAAERIAPRL